MRSTCFSYIAFALAFGLTACGPQRMMDHQAYRAWYQNSLEELQVHKTVNSLDLLVQYVPGDVRILSLLESQPAKKALSADSLQSLADHMLTFEVKIKPSENVGGDLMFRGIKSHADYDERLKDLTFHAKEQFELEANGQTLYPVLSHFENNIGLTREKVLILVFSTDEALSQSSSLRLNWDDQNFSTGKHHFVFAQDLIAELPSLNYETLIDHDDL